MIVCTAVDDRVNTEDKKAATQIDYNQHAANY